MTYRYTSTLDTITLLEEVQKIIRNNDYKINKLMLIKDAPNFKGLQPIVEPQVFVNKQLNYLGAKVLMHKPMACLVLDVHQQVQSYPEYDDEFFGEYKEEYGDEPEEHCDYMFNEDFEHNSIN